MQNLACICKTSLTLGFDLVSFSTASISFTCLLKHLHYLHMENHALGEVMTFKFASQPRINPNLQTSGIKTHYGFPKWSKALSPKITISCLPTYAQICLVQGLNTPRALPRAPFLEPSFFGTYVAHESIKLRMELNPTLRFVIQIVVGSFHSRLDLGPNYANPHT